LTQIAQTGRDNLIGSLFMIISMAGFAIEDSFLKYAADTFGDIPSGQTVVLLTIVGMAVFGIAARWAGQPLWSDAYLSRPLLLRGVFEVSGRLSYTLAFILAPLITATAILQATPLVVVAGAAIFLGEKTSLRQWLAVVIGFGGVMLILRPWGASFDVFAILAVLGMIGFAGRDLATRASPAVLSNAQRGFIGYAMFFGAGCIIWGAQGRIAPMPPMAIVLTLIAGAGGVLGYFALTVAMRRGSVGAVTPWRYTRLIFGAALVLIMFNETIDMPTIIGSFIVVISGLLGINRQR
jgi:drug/metabolite transporter (DMT)-like permease